MKRKRGRPRKIIPLDKLNKKRTLSDYTKRKIAENNKKFSICKLCKKQCKGFRGLVDHMHRDHSDYKPWQCSFCDTKTAFVKTLYRHLKQVHKVIYFLHISESNLQFLFSMLRSTSVRVQNVGKRILELNRCYFTSQNMKRKTEWRTLNVPIVIWLLKRNKNFRNILRNNMADPLNVSIVAGQCILILRKNNFMSTMSKNVFNCSQEWHFLHCCPLRIKMYDLMNYELSDIWK